VIRGRTARRAALAAFAAAAGLALGACGDLEDDPGPDQGDLTSAAAEQPKEPAADLPEPAAGQVEVDGRLDGSLTNDVKSGFDRDAGRNGLAIDVIPAAGDEAQGFADLCAGRTDVVDASREITDEELQACTDNGLKVVEFRIAFDATVIVTRNERDVGADCVNFDQLRAMFQTGTPVSAWNQVNTAFLPIELTTTGPEEGASDFELFGQRVLGEAEPTLSSLRSDYIPHARESQIKDDVAGKDAPEGRVGIIGFSYYELFEDKLRPLEIDGQTGDRCVFPSEETISSELYPLERTLRLYTTQRSLDRQEVQTFLTYYLKHSGALAVENELVPIDDALRKVELQRIDDPKAYGESGTGQVDEPPDPASASAPPETATTTTTTETEAASG
jgi:phosphate transport system substrate-binding protein